jgi:hypothetical protein
MHEDVVKDHDARQHSVPCVVLEDCRWRATGAVKDDVGSVDSRQSAAFGNGDRIASSEGAEYRRERRFSATILGVNER